MMRMEEERTTRTEWQDQAPYKSGTDQGKHRTTQQKKVCGNELFLRTELKE